jgi:hypothetical protein
MAKRKKGKSRSIRFDLCLDEQLVKMAEAQNVNVTDIVVRGTLQVVLDWMAPPPPSTTYSNPFTGNVVPLTPRSPVSGGTPGGMAEKLIIARSKK